MIEPMISIESAILYLNQVSLSDFEVEQLYCFIDGITAAIISYCGYDPREELLAEEFESELYQCSNVLSLVAGRMLMQLFPSIQNHTTGIESQSFGEFAIKFAPDIGIDSFSQQILSRYRKLSIF